MIHHCLVILCLSVYRRSSGPLVEFFTQCSTGFKLWNIAGQSCITLTFAFCKASLIILTTCGLTLSCFKAPYDDFWGNDATRLWVQEVDNKCVLIHLSDNYVTAKIKLVKILVLLLTDTLDISGCVSHVF